MDISSTWRKKNQLNYKKYMDISSTWRKENQLNYKQYMDISSMLRKWSSISFSFKSWNGLVFADKKV